MSDGRVIIDILADSSKYESAVARLGSVTQSAFGAIGGVASAALKAAAAGAAAAAGGVAWMGKEALSAYSDYEQLSGGVAKLYGNAGQSVEEYAAANNKAVDQVIDAWNRNQSAQQTVMSNAAQAYKTAGMSANQYMEQATSFSASLINSLGGDTQKAAEMTDVAMRAMSDNVNTFGTSMTDVQNAFQGFSKQNYTMLDNLKLGYGGTKEEMQRLIDDANAWGAANGQASDLSIDSFADVVQAIQQIQEKQQIAGTTAREAATTIEGSVNMAKAAWQNWLAGLGNNEADMGQLTTQLVDSVTTAAGNIIPRLQIIANTIITTFPGVITQLAGAVSANAGDLFDAVSQVGQTLVESLPDIGGQMAQAVPAAMQGLVDAVQALGPALAGALPVIGQQLATGVPAAFAPVVAALAAVDWGAALQTLLDGIGGILTQAVGVIVANGPAVITAVLGLVAQIASYLGEHATDILQAVTDIVNMAAISLAENAPTILAAAGQLFMGICQALPVILPQLAADILGLVVTIAAYLVQNAPTILAGAVTCLGAILDAVGQVGTLAVDAVASLLGTIVDTIVGWAVSMATGGSEGGSEFLSGLSGTISGAIGAVAGVLASIIGGVASWVGSMISNAASAGSGFLSSLVGTVSGAIGGVGGVLSSIIGNVASFVGQMASGAASAASSFASNIIGGLQSIPGRVAEIGGQIINGLVNGIRDGMGRVAGAIADVANNAISSAKSALGIASPSRVFRGIGEYVNQGLAIGIGQGEGVERAVQSLAERTVGAWGSHGVRLFVPELALPSAAVANGQQAWAVAAQQSQAADDARHASLMAKLDALLSAVDDAAGAAASGASIVWDKREVGRLVREVV
jgi:phage-related protein